MRQFEEKKGEKMKENVKTLKCQFGITNNTLRYYLCTNFGLNINVLIHILVKMLAIQIVFSNNKML